MALGDVRWIDVAYILDIDGEVDSTADSISKIVQYVQETGKVGTVMAVQVGLGALSVGGTRTKAVGWTSDVITAFNKFGD